MGLNTGVRNYATIELIHILYKISLGKIKVFIKAESVIPLM